VRPGQGAVPSILADPRLGGGKAVPGPARQTARMPPRDRSELVVLLVVWVLPLLLVAGLLAAAGLPQLAVALVVIEVVVAGVVAIARRRPARPAAPAQRPWLIPLAMVLVLVALAGLGFALG
jgi:hypothetical protein